MRGSSVIKADISNVKDKSRPDQHVESLSGFLKNFLSTATPAQVLQAKMIQDVFTTMDADHDGLISFGDAKAYFRSLGKPSSDNVVRRWIAKRDVDQDGAVSFVEYFTSFAIQFDPNSKFKKKDGELISEQVSALTTAFGAVKIGNSSFEVLAACEAIEECVTKI